MNCQNFENVVNDLARHQIMEAAVRDLALRHTDDCDSCSARLRAEQALTNNLKDLSAELRSLHSAGAPSGLEARLLAEFRNHSSAVRVASQVNRNYGVYATIAALFIIVLGIVAVRSLNFGTANIPVNTAQQAKPPMEENIGAAETSDTAVSIAPTSRPLEVSRRPRRKNAAGRIVPAGNRQSLTASNRDSEIATEFFPVGYSSNLSVQDGGQVVRVEMPRSAMARFGVPVNMDRYDEKVKADVLVGSDGLARAIRFVQ